MKFSVVTSALSICMAIAQPVVTSTECDPISKYTTEWFLENTEEKWSSMPFDSIALFYTQGLSEKARQFAGQAINNKITIWDVWPCKYYFIKATRQNPLWCIMSDIEQERYYFGNMSEAFAMKAHGVATVMHRDIFNPPLSTIWGTVELPALKKYDNRWGRVDFIEAMDSENSEYRIVVWDRFREISGKFIEKTEQRLQKILQPKSEDVIGDLEKRGEIEACPMIKIDSSHPLW